MPAIFTIGVHDQAGCIRPVIAQKGRQYVIKGFI